MNRPLHWHKCLPSTVGRWIWEGAFAGWEAVEDNCAVSYCGDFHAFDDSEEGRKDIRDCLPRLLKVLIKCDRHAITFLQSLME